MKWKAPGNPDIIVTGTENELLFADIHPGLWQQDGSSEGIRAIQGETELCGSKERAGEIASNVPGLSPLPAQPTNAIFLGLGIPPKWH